MIKSLNNNLVLAINEKSEEFVLFGKGIGFNSKKGEPINQNLVTKIFESKNQIQNFSSILASISPSILLLTERIVEKGEHELNKKLSASIIVALSDHIQTAIERQSTAQDFVDNVLQWEIPFLYYKEYELGKTAIAMIEEETKVLLPEVEASFIALHFVNAQDGLESMNETILITRVTKTIIRIIQSLFDISLNKKSINYSRFVTHIRYFLNRYLQNETFVSENNNELYQIIKVQYPKSFACGLMIRKRLERDYQIVVSDEEMVYLIIHIERIIKNYK